MRDRDERESHDGEDRREDHDLAGISQRVVEADDRDEAEDATDDDEPRAGEERTARIVDVDDPVDRVLSGSGDQHVHATRHHEDDADDEHDGRQHGAHGAHGDDVEALHPADHPPRGRRESRVGGRRGRCPPPFNYS